MAWIASEASDTIVLLGGENLGIASVLSGYCDPRSAGVDRFGANRVRRSRSAEATPQSSSFVVTAAGRRAAPGRGARRSSVDERTYSATQTRRRRSIATPIVTRNRRVESLHAAAIARRRVAAGRSASGDLLALGPAKASARLAAAPSDELPRPRVADDQRPQTECEQPPSAVQSGTVSSLIPARACLPRSSPSLAATRLGVAWHWVHIAHLLASPVQRVRGDAVSGAEAAATGLDGHRSHERRLVPYPSPRTNRRTLRRPPVPRRGRAGWAGSLAGLAVPSRLQPGVAELNQADD